MIIKIFKLSERKLIVAKNKEGLVDYISTEINIDKVLLRGQTINRLLKLLPIEEYCVLNKRR